MKGHSQFVAIGLAALVGIVVVLLASGPPAQGEQSSVVAALGLPSASATPEPTQTLEPEPLTLLRQAIFLLVAPR